MRRNDTKHEYKLDVIVESNTNFISTNAPKWLVNVVYCVLCLSNQF